MNTAVASLAHLRCLLDCIYLENDFFSMKHIPLELLHILGNAPLTAVPTKQAVTEQSTPMLDSGNRIDSKYPKSWKTRHSGVSISLPSPYREDSTECCKYAGRLLRPISNLPFSIYFFCLILRKCPLPSTPLPP